MEKNTPRSPELFKLKALAFCLLSFFLAAVFYWGGISNLAFRWEAQPEYSHGYFIPLVALYILWEKRACWGPYFGQTHWVGFVWMLLALLLHFVGEVSALFILIHYSLLLMFLGLAYVFLGAGARHVWLSIFLLVFAIPIPYVIEVVLTAKLQLLSSSFGVGLIRLFDIPVYLSGNIIDLGEFKLHVVEACSGLRYLYPLLSLGVITAYFYQTVIWKKVFVVVSTIPLSIVMNSLRIAVTGVLVENYGTGAAEGFIHGFEGWLVFVVCVAVLVAEIALLEKMTGTGNLFSAFRFDIQNYVKPISRIHFNTSYKSLIGAPAVLLVYGMAYFSFADRDAPNTQDVSFATFPLQLQNWAGHRNSLDEEVVQALGFDDYFFADYSDNDVLINAYLAYYKNQRKGVSPHSPKVCIPGGGWEITKFQRIKVGDMPVNRVIIQKGEQKQLVYYWFVERGRIIANEYIKKWWLLHDAIKYNRSEGALVRLVSQFDSAIAEEEIERNMQSFIAHSHPKIMEYLPRAQ